MDCVGRGFWCHGVIGRDMSDAWLFARIEMESGGEKVLMSWVRQEYIEVGLPRGLMSLNSAYSTAFTSKTSI